MKEKLISVADVVQNAVSEFCRTGNISEVAGKGADGGTSYRIDRIAEEAALDAIDRAGIDVNVLSEESPYRDRGKQETLILDPVDGSHNALHRIPFYSVSIAIGSRTLSGMRFALVRNLTSGDTYYAEKGKGAQLNGSPISVRAYSERESLFLVFMGAHASSIACDVSRRSDKVRSLGSASLEMCMVASGNADLFYMRGVDSTHALRIVDIAASSLILREAGGELYDMTGNIFDMSLDIKERRSLIAVGDRSLRRLVT